MALHANGHTKHPAPRKAAEQMLANGWSVRSLEGWLRQVSHHHPNEAEAWIAPIVRQARIIENRRQRENETV